MTTSALRLSCAAFIAAIGLLSAGCATTSGTQPAATPQYVVDAVASKERPAADVARDADRKPAELLALSGVKPGDKVLEFAGFGNYFTRLLSPIVGPKGSITMLDLPYTEARSGKASREFIAAHPNTQYVIADYNTAVLPQNLDSVFIVLYYHDLGIQKIDTAQLNAKIFKALKPGGIYFIVDHNAAPGASLADAQKIHRIDPAIIRKEVTAAGFELVTDSKLLANPGDDHSWQPFTAGKRGTTDQSVLKFRKPKK
jgi:predicted methyltransferase